MNILAGNAALDSTCYPCVDIKDKYVRTSGSGFMVKTDNTAYQALVLVWLWCGNIISYRWKITQIIDKL